MHRYSVIWKRKKENFWEIHKIWLIISHCINLHNFNHFINHISPYFTENNCKSEFIWLLFICFFYAVAHCSGFEDIKCDWKQFSCQISRSDIAHNEHLKRLFIFICAKSEQIKGKKGTYVYIHQNRVAYHKF